MVIGPREIEFGKQSSDNFRPRSRYSSLGDVTFNLFFCTSRDLDLQQRGQCFDGVGGVLGMKVDIDANIIKPTRIKQSFWRFSLYICYETFALMLHSKHRRNVHPYPCPFPKYREQKNTPVFLRYPILSLQYMGRTHRGMLAWYFRGVHNNHWKRKCTWRVLAIACPWTQELSKHILNEKIDG